MSLPRRLLDTTALAWMDTPGLDASTISAPTSAMMMGLRPAPRALATPRATVTTVGPERGVLSISAPRYVRFHLLEIVSIAFHRGKILYINLCSIPLPHQFCDDTGTATCTKSPGDFACNCADNYGGQYCQTDLCARCNDDGTSSCTGGPYQFNCNCAVSLEACCSNCLCIPFSCNIIFCLERSLT